MSYEPTLTAPSIPRVKFKSSSSGRLWKSCVHRWFSQLQFGTLSVADGFGLSHYGSEGEFQSHMNIKDPAFYKKVALGGSMGAAESYMDGDWECDDLFSLFCLFSKQRALIETMDSSWTRWSRPFLKFGEWLSKNSISGSRKNIAAHYDLGNDFFELFLDQTLTYSSGIFETEQSTLEEASYAKLDRMCRIAELKRGDHVLEIGSGWGSFAIYAASHYGVKVTTITLSKEQKKIAEKRVEKAGLSDSVKVELIDYRHVEGVLIKWYLLK
jgi:cyclopropane-fatty-acyl-phospholipid synthase